MDPYDKEDHEELYEEDDLSIDEFEDNAHDQFEAFLDEIEDEDLDYL